ncbi:MAG: HAD family phosphatase [Limnochordaceae bacterium]|nr:HAD family phosphatase [Limnochordaceae bacterium]
MSELARPRWVILDLDDTLLDAQGHLSLANARAVQEVVSRGLPVILATGRRWAACREFISPLGLTTPVICLCGADIRQSDGKVVRQQRLERAFAQKIIQTLAVEGFAVGVALDDHTYWTDRPAEEPTARLRIDARLREKLPEAPFQLAVRTVPERIQRALELLTLYSSRLTLLPIRSHKGKHRLLILDKGASKEKAAAWVGQQLLDGLTLAEAVAMGDGIVDLALLEQARISVAMDIADPEIKAKVKVVAPPGPDAVAAVLRQLVLA